MNQKKVSPKQPIPQTPINKARAARQRRRTLTNMVIGLVVVVAVVVVATVAILNGQTTQTVNYASNNTTVTVSDGNGNIVGLQTFSNLSRNHTSASVTYAQVPPVGGDHNPAWQNCGIYSSPIQNVNAVHSMEHGAVWITYQPTLASASVNQLRSLVSGHSYFLLSPYPGLPSPVVASAWGVQLKVDTSNDPRLALFLKKYEQGPQTPELGATCSGGVGSPES